MPEKKVVTKVKVKLIAPHTHAGKDCKKGDQIEVTTDQKVWMAKRNIIEGEG